MAANSGSKDERIHFRCTKEFKKKVQEVANYENRSVANLIETLLKDKVEEYNKKKKGDNTKR